MAPLYALLDWFTLMLAFTLASPLATRVTLPLLASPL